MSNQFLRSYAVVLITDQNPTQKRKRHGLGFRKEPLSMRTYGAVAETDEQVHHKELPA